MAEDLPEHPTKPRLFTEDLVLDFSIHSDLCDSPIDQPPSSAFASEADSALVSETSSALASEFDFPLHSSPKAAKQSGLLNFFSKMPSEEFHTRWRKRKRENAERDQEEYEERKRKDEAQKLKKQAHRREQNRISQQRVRERQRKGKERVRLQESSVSLFS